MVSDGACVIMVDGCVGTALTFSCCLDLSLLS